MRAQAVDILLLGKYAMHSDFAFNQQPRPLLCVCECMYVQVA